MKCEKSEFERQVGQALSEASDPKVQRIPDEKVRSDWQLKRIELLKRAGDQRNGLPN
jgi:hypothetical protein